MMAVKKRFIFSGRNYCLLLIAVSLIVSGYILMTGGSNSGGNEFNNEIYSFRRITLAPVILLAGYALIIQAIMWNPKTSSSNGNYLSGKV